MNTSKLIKRVGVKGLTKISLVATLYIVLTLSFPGISYGPIQARPSELLNFLAFLDPLYIIALTLGCAISNFYCYGIVDVIFGSLATLTATYLMYKSKNIFIASLWPTVCCVFVAAELYIFFGEAFWFSLLTICIGEFLIMTILGLPLFLMLLKNRRFVEIIRIDLGNKTYLEKLKLLYSSKTA